MQQIDLQQASQELPALIAQVKAGEEIVLTREGKPIARLVSETHGTDQSLELTPEQQARARQATASIRARAARLNLGSFDIEEFKRDRDEGRR